MPQRVTAWIDSQPISAIMVSGSTITTTPAICGTYGYLNGDSGWTPVTGDDSGQMYTIVTSAAPLDTYIYQQVEVDSNNTALEASGDLGYDAPIAGATWTGLSASTLGIVGIQVSFKCDQNCTVYVDQSPDGDNWDVVDEFEYVTTRTFGVTVQAVNSALRVRVTNNGVATPTLFRLQTCLCPIVEAVPRALDEHQRLKTSTTHTDNYGWEAACTPFEELRVIEPTRLVGTIFEGTANWPDQSFWTFATSAGGASAMTAGGQLALRTYATASGASACVQTVRNARYVASNANQFRAVIQQDAASAENTRRWGAFTTDNGAFFMLSGTTASVVTRKGGVDTVVKNGSFNGDLGSTVSDYGTNAQTYEIYWTQRYVYFVLDDEILHTVTASSTTWSNSVMLPVRLENHNSANSDSDITMNVRVAAIHRLGPLATDPTRAYIAGAVASTVLKTGPGKLHRIVCNASANGSKYYIYDDSSTASGNCFAAGVFGAQGIPASIEFGCPFWTGLSIATQNANTNITVIYE